MLEDKQTSSNASHAKPRRMTLRVFSALLWLIGLEQWIVALRAMRYGSSYTALGVSFWPGLLILSGITWGLLFTWSGWRLWANRNGSSKLVFLVIGAYALYQISWGLFFLRADYAQARLPFIMLTTGVLIALSFWTLTRQRR